MNYLQLVQDVWRESGSGGRIPSTVVNQTGEMDRLVRWVRHADVFIQALYADWNFLWGQQQFVTQPGIFVYSPAQAVSLFDRYAWKIADVPVDCLEYLEVKDAVRPSEPGAPAYVVILPSNNIRIDPTPDAEYLVEYDYFSPVLEMAINDNSQPAIPPEFHKAIVGKALMEYAEYENAPEIMQKGQSMYVHWIRSMEAKQLPGKRHFHTTAEGNDMVIHVE